jgi:hypothetical protein
VSDNQRREVLKHRVEHIVPTPPPYGGTIKDVNLAIHHALQEIKARGGRIDYDDVLRFETRDDAIVVFYEYDEVLPDVSAASSDDDLFQETHPDARGRVAWPVMPDGESAHASVSCCGRAPCVAGASRWVHQMTGHDGVWVPPRQID